MPGRILVVDDEPSMVELLEIDLGKRGFEVSCCTSSEQALRLLRDEAFDVVLTDLRMPGLSGVDLCERIVANRPGTPVVVMTAFGNLESAVAAIRAGAYDFVTKPIELDVLAFTLERAVKHAALQEQVKLLSDAVERTRLFDQLMGQSEPMQELYDQLARVADSEVSVLITGESGTGKELVARALHRTSRRAAGPFVAVNCAAIPEALLESELFGFERGAFTGAQTARKGVLLQAHGGTLFLDEIGEMPLSLQPKLLRALEEKCFRPVGGDREVRFTASIVAATNRDIETAVEEGRFREDLYFRINVIQLQIPPLRSRGMDILLLAQHFLEKAATRAGQEITGISEPAAAKLLEYEWPGNVREAPQRYRTRRGLDAIREDRGRGPPGKSARVPEESPRPRRRQSHRTGPSGRGQTTLRPACSPDGGRQQDAGRPDSGSRPKKRFIENSNATGWLTGNRSSRGPVSRGFPSWTAGMKPWT